MHCFFGSYIVYFTVLGPFVKDNTVKLYYQSYQVNGFVAPLLGLTKQITEVCKNLLSLLFNPVFLFNYLPLSQPTFLTVSTTL